jgi:hypothetical protein
MGRFNGPQGIVTNGLVLNLDAGDPDSYTRSQPPFIEVLVVAGGGGGGMDMGGGGGGGGVIYNSAYQITNAAGITVTVGAGGVGAPAGGTNGQPSFHQFTIPATSGGNSVFGIHTAIGGGFGGSSYRGYTPGIAGGNGGSGGGSSGYNDNAGTFFGGQGTPGQGFRGGNSTQAYYSGGGGGAGGNGVDSTNQPNGGPGILYSILGIGYYWGGGGGGASYSLSTGGNGGIGGGGGGAVGTTTGGEGYNNGQPGGGGIPNSQTNTPGGNGGANTGGGGGGGSHYNLNNKGGNGGSGIVIVRYPGLPAATGGTITYLNGYTIHTFTTSGTFTPYLWNDLSGGGRNGTLVNGVSFIPNINGGYFDFDGTDDYVLYPSLLNVGNTFTINFWIKPTSKTRQTIFSDGYPYQANKGFFITCPGNVATEFFISLGNDQKYTTSNIGALTTGAWQMVTARVNGASELMKLYVNAIETSYQAQMDANITVQYDTGVFVTGINNGFSGDVLNSDIGILQIYNRALSVAEITQNFNATRERFGISSGLITNGLVLHLDAGNLGSYPGSGNIWYDLTGNGNNATKNGNAANPIWNAAGYFTFAASDGSTGANNIFTVANSATLSNLTDVTIQFICAMETKTPVGNDYDWMGIVSKGEEGNQRPGTSVNQSPGLRYYHIETPGGVDSSANLFTNADYTGNKWNMFQTRVSNAGGTQGWLNGVQVATAGNTTTGNTSPTYIGSNGFFELFKGKLGIVCIYNRALSNAELIQNYNYLKGRFGI